MNRLQADRAESKVAPDSELVPVECPRPSVRKLSRQKRPLNQYIHLVLFLKPTTLSRWCPHHAKFEPEAFISRPRFRVSEVYQSPN